MSFLSLLRKGLAEFVATAMLVFSAAQINTATINSDKESTNASILGAGLGIGLTLACMAASVGHISGGHMNPGVSLAFLLTGGMSIIELLVYWPSQILGCMLGGTLSRWTMDNETWVSTKGGMVTLDTEISYVWQGIEHKLRILLEGIVTFVLVMTVLLTVEQAVSGAPLFIGLAVVVGIFHSGLITGGGLNPARAFGPAFAMWAFNADEYKNMHGVDVWENHWIYWVGPPAGAIIAAVLFKLIFAEQGHRLIREKTPPPPQEELNGDTNHIEMKAVTTGNTNLGYEQNGNVNE